MKKVVLSVVAALAVTAAPALAADMPVKGKRVVPVAAPSPWDIAFGAALMSDYNFRGISQSDRGPAVSAYIEPRYNITPTLQLYAGIAGSSVKLATDPTAEIDFYGGIRPTFGDFAFDFGGIYYYYPKERALTAAMAPASGNTTIGDTDFWEVYAKVAWTINPVLTLGANLYYSPSWLKSGADGTYASGTGKVTLPSTFLPADVGMYLSGEAGYYWFGTTDAVPGVFIANDGVSGWDLPDYAYWNLGVGFTWKVFTLDLRYHDTDLSKEECNSLTADPSASASTAVINNFTTTGASNWCGAAFVAKLSFDLMTSSLK